MWSFGKNPEPRFRNRNARLMAATWHRTGATGAGIAVAAPPMATRSWFSNNRSPLGREALAITALPPTQSLAVTV